MLLSVLAISAVGTSACSRKTGCPAYESAQTRTNRKGELPSKRGKSNLFPKEMRRN